MNNVQCPICGLHQERFLPTGVIPRPNAMCGQCWALERHRLLWLYLIMKKIIASDMIRMLHFAPECQLHMIFSTSPLVDYWPVDYSPENYKYETGVPVIKADIVDIPFNDNWFDGILCNHVLEHIPDDQKAMKELLRVLKPGGWAILQVPLSGKYETYEDFTITSPQERFKHFGQEDHVRCYGLDYKDRLELAGFEVTVDNFVTRFSPEQLHYYGLIPDEMIYFCRKR